MTKLPEKISRVDSLQLEVMLLKVQQAASVYQNLKKDYESELERSSKKYSFDLNHDSVEFSTCAIKRKPRPQSISSVGGKTAP